MIRRSPILVAALLGSLTLSAQGPTRALVPIVLDDAVSDRPLSGRLLLFMTSNPKPLEVITPALGADAESVWIAAREVRGWRPGETVRLDVDEIAWPRPFGSAPEADYQVMALLDVDHNAAYNPLSAGDIRSVVTRMGPPRGAGNPTELHLSERVNSAEAPLPAGQEMIAFASPALSDFWGRPITMRGITLLPPGYATSKQRYPTVYHTHGFGGGMGELRGTAQTLAADTAAGKLPPMIWVLLDESFSTGTHEFADSVNNGPWGRALTTELIASLERKYRMDAKTSGRFLNGHSSGGWATMWLQVTYPELFGGTWSTSPDPVDFGDFTNIDLYGDKNAFRQRNGIPTPLVRESGRPAETVQQYAGQEAVLGEYGGQFASFEWVFSPRGADGRPAPMFNRKSGDIDPAVVEHWRRYDVATILTSNARNLVKRLRGKIHIIVGTQDTFYLDEPARLLQERLAPLGYDAKFTYLAGRTHFDLYSGGLMTRIAQQMYAVARPGANWQPAVAPDPATKLTQ